jgi:hypothetical protein
VNTPCKLCEKRRARRYCPGVGGDICPVCCGTERENTIDCPLECEYLQEARQHERLPDLPAVELPNQDVRLTEQFLREQDHLVIWMSHSLARAMEAGKAVDWDAREALEAMIKTYRTLESGLIYETKPQNPYAAGIQDGLKAAVEELRKRVAEESGMAMLKDTDVLGVLVFLQRLEFQHNNGRKKGRAFLDFLRSYFPTGAAQGVAP